jgi:hypothetical protein
MDIADAASGFRIMAGGIESLIREGARLKGEIDCALSMLRKINLKIAESVVFEKGKQTAYLFGAGYKVKVRMQENIAWDQEKLLKLREYLPEGKFGELFKVVYEPTSKNAIYGFVAHADPDLADGVKWCMSVKPGAPHVTYEPIDKTGH